MQGIYLYYIVYVCVFSQGCCARCCSHGNKKQQAIMQELSHAQNPSLILAIYNTALYNLRASFSLDLNKNRELLSAFQNICIWLLTGIDQ